MEITKVGIIGAGTMGGAVSLLFAEKGLDVSIVDTSRASLDKVAKNAEAAGLSKRIHICEDYDTLCQGLGSPKVFIFSLPNGRPGDSVVAQLKSRVSKGDILIDASNENYERTQTRQEILRPLDVAYIGLGISGGSFGARYGPSLMPGGEKWAVEQVLPLLSRIAAKDDQGRPCVTNIGTGGSGHFVKMIHNGIEHGVMSSLCEAWEIMDKCLKMTGDEIGDVFDSWCEKGELKGNFLVSISGPICRTRSPVDGGSLLHQIRDAVVQDANDSEGTGVWANIEAVASHVPAPSLTAAHYLRLASAEIEQRSAVKASIGTVSPKPFAVAPEKRAHILEQLRQAVYVTSLACFIQGFDVMERKNRQEGWGVDMTRVLNIWRAGCIIKSDYIFDILDVAYAEGSDVHPLCRPGVSNEIKKSWPSLKAIVLEGLKADAHLPCLSATLEYLKYIGGTDLPTCFSEAQLDSFGAHGFDLKSEPIRHLLKGNHHETWSGA
ncbi:6-phosphogluconate dehydrogenase (decarboxylating) [Fusarium denticulatum]|uniref:6-phosphogluconate dehydrogenase, decarboxylating n=1 Tax=Fusarium denticulatum TaxID=48507 RepID=A0A8H5UGC7_9HYPO|nr:6-phosphogluconate dehydrogenase (decarboxylating) [Fusarium denticulatum]